MNKKDWRKGKSGNIKHIRIILLNLRPEKYVFENISKYNIFPKLNLIYTPFLYISIFIFNELNLLMFYTTTSKVKKYIYFSLTYDLKWDRKKKTYKRIFTSNAGKSHNNKKAQSNTFFIPK